MYIKQVMGYISKYNLKKIIYQIIYKTIKLITQKSIKIICLPQKITIINGYTS